MTKNEKEGGRQRERSALEMDIGSSVIELTFAGAKDQTHSNTKRPCSPSSSHFIGFLSNFYNDTVRSLLHVQPMAPYRSLHLTLAKEANTCIFHSAGYFFFTFKSHNDCPLSQTLCTQPFTGRVCLVISQYTLLFCLWHWKGSCMFTQLN